ncbi:methyltransferase domain-containing protein [Sorangium sp. So ce448]|uniref:methyltransferase domain-containing protein n=1 Tax=Sorangium sp. So ce448 TaxID=3133314 RepID=UPI003F601CD7
MSGLSLVFDTPQLAQDYEVRSADRQFRHGKRLIVGLGVRPGDHVLDVGSGTGLLAEHVAGLVGPTGKVLGIDPLPLRVEIAQQKLTGR